MTRSRVHLILLVLALGAGIVLAVGYVFVPPNTVVLKDDGFHPRTLTVHAGETVTFKNKTDSYFWPASDFHPSHGLYPAFDAMEPIPPGGSWSFTFSEPGTFRYHDHLAAYYFGLVHVRNADGTVAEEECKERGGDLNCWQNEVFTALANDGLDAAYDTIARLYEDNPAFASSCHYLTHNVGLASYQFFKENPRSIISPKATACASGFYHGFMEGLLGATGDVTAAARVCDDIGKALGTDSPDARLQCFHGIGHGAIETAVASTGVFEGVDAVIRDAVAMCEQASEGVEERYRCVSGVYNGIANFYITEQYGLSLEAEPPLFCRSQPDVYKESCYGNMNTILMALADEALAPALAQSLALSEPEHRRKSVLYLAGLHVLAHSHDMADEDMAEACRTVADPYRLDCIEGHAHGFLEHGTPGREYEDALQFCAEPTLRDDERTACYAYTLGTLSGWYSPEKTADICSMQPAALQAYCAG